jgi:hypothetical protein
LVEKNEIAYPIDPALCGFGAPEVLQGGLQHLVEEARFGRWLDWLRGVSRGHGKGDLPNQLLHVTGHLSAI